MWNALDKYGIDNRQDNPKTVAYLRESVKELLLTYPLLKGIGVSAGENMDRRLTGEYSNENWIWKTYGFGGYGCQGRSARPACAFHFPPTRLHFSEY